MLLAHELMKFDREEDCVADNCTFRFVILTHRYTVLLHKMCCSVMLLSSPSRPVALLHVQTYTMYSTCIHTYTCKYMYVHTDIYRCIYIYVYVYTAYVHTNAQIKEKE